MQNKQLVTENQSSERLFTQQEINDMMRKRLVRARQQLLREMESRKLNMVKMLIPKKHLCDK